MAYWILKVSQPSEARQVKVRAVRITDRGSRATNLPHLQGRQRQSREIQEGEWNYIELRVMHIRVHLEVSLLLLHFIEIKCKYTNKDKDGKLIDCKENKFVNIKLENCT